MEIAGGCDRDDVVAGSGGGRIVVTGMVVVVGRS